MQRMIQVRPANLDDAGRLLELRRQAIVELASRDLSAEQILAWLARVTGSDMTERIRDMEIWIAEISGEIAGWAAVDGDYLEGLYTAPRFERQGVASMLLDRAESVVRQRGAGVIRADASRNAEAFYYRRGYVAAGPEGPGGATPVLKRLDIGHEGPERLDAP